MNDGFFNAMHTRVLGMLVLLMAVLALFSYAILNFAKVDFLNPAPATIQVMGEGEVEAKPDLGQFTFSVTAQGETAAEAQEISGTKINDILAYLREQEIEDKDVKVQNYNLYPRWRYEERLCPVGSYCPPGERVEDGYEATQSVTVRVRQTDKAGVLIAGVGERGATNISDLRFTIDEPEAIQAEARALAIADAQAKAEVLAAQLGVEIVRLSGYSENGGYAPMFYQSRAMAMDDMAEEAGFGGAEMPVGEETTTAQVTLVYQVR